MSDLHNNKKECCELCEDGGMTDTGFERFCRNDDCPNCHSSPNSNEEKKEECYNCNTDIKFDGKMPLCLTCKNKPPMDNTLPSSPSPSSDSMEKLRQEFYDAYDEMPENFERVSRTYIADFWLEKIKSEKALSEREARERIGKELAKIYDKHITTELNEKRVPDEWALRERLIAFIINLTNTRD